ncbi:MAG TPA: DUF962 domain-containing protein [Chitinophagales bacterium]|nr:DUF962 domain-containing protein [Chitinophagales bacterium]
MEKKYKTFWDFYPYYLTEHSDPICRATHYIGTTGLFVVVAAAVYFGNAKLLFLLPVVGYGFAWLGHFAFEKNKPATFQYPLYSLGSDFVMYFHFLTGQITQKVEEAKKTIATQA